MPLRLCATAPHVIEVLEFESMPLAAGQVRIANQFASGKHGTDTALFDGVNFAGQRFDLDGRYFRDDPTAKPQFKSPMALGTTTVGTVVEVAPDVTDYAVGDRVIALTRVASESVVTPENLWPLGDIDPLEALCIEPGYVSIHAVRESNVRWGDTVAVIGLGAIGLIALQMAVGAGASTVIGVDPLPRRREWALAHGVHAALDPVHDDVPFRIHELTSGKGVDVAIEVSGKYQALETAIKSTCMRGTVCSAGFYQGEAHGLWLGREWHHNRLTMVVPHGCGWGHEPRDYPRWDTRRAYDAIVEMLRQRRLHLDGIIDPLVAIHEMPAVFDRIEHDPGTVIKYGVKFD